MENITLYEAMEAIDEILTEAEENMTESKNAIKDDINFNKYHTQWEKKYKEFAKNNFKVDNGILDLYKKTGKNEPDVYKRTKGAMGLVAAGGGGAAIGITIDINNTKDEIKNEKEKDKPDEKKIEKLTKKLNKLKMLRAAAIGTSALGAAAAHKADTDKFFADAKSNMVKQGIKKREKEFSDSMKKAATKKANEIKKDTSESHTMKN